MQLLHRLSAGVGVLAAVLLRSGKVCSDRPVPACSSALSVQGVPFEKDQASVWTQPAQMVWRFGKHAVARLRDQPDPHRRATLKAARLVGEQAGPRLQMRVGKTPAPKHQSKWTQLGGIVAAIQTAQYFRTRERTPATYHPSPCRPFIQPHTLSDLVLCSWFPCSWFLVPGLDCS